MNDVDDDAIWEGTPVEPKSPNKPDNHRWCIKCGEHDRWSKMVGKQVYKAEADEEDEKWKEVRGTTAEVAYLREHGDRRTPAVWLHMCTWCNSQARQIDRIDVVHEIASMKSAPNRQRAKKFGAAYACNKVCVQLVEGSKDIRGFDEETRSALKNAMEAIEQPDKVVPEDMPQLSNEERRQLNEERLKMSRRQFKLAAQYTYIYIYMGEREGRKGRCKVGREGRQGRGDGGGSEGAEDRCKRGERRGISSIRAEGPH